MLRNDFETTLDKNVATVKSICHLSNGRPSLTTLNDL